MTLSWQVLFFVSFVLLSMVAIQFVLADSWYEGKGLKQGDYFRYNVCWTNWNYCAPLVMEFWVQNQTSNGNWNLQFVVTDGAKVQSGLVTIDSNTSFPLNYSSNLSDYANVYKNTLAWIANFSNKTQPKNFTSNWGITGSAGGAPVSPVDQEQVTVKAGTFNAWIIEWQSFPNNKIWLAPNLPFPIKGTIYDPYCACAVNPPIFLFELLETGNSQTPSLVNSSSSPFNLTNSLLSPLKQFKNGVAVKDIRCKEDLVPLVKSEDGSPACVGTQTAQKLIVRGWGTEVLTEIKHTK